jgi:hypothetical protein
MWPPPVPGWQHEQRWLSRDDLGVEGPGVLWSVGAWGPLRCAAGQGTIKTPQITHTITTQHTLILGLFVPIPRRCMIPGAR